METIDANKLKSIMLAKGIGVSGLAKAAGIQSSIVSRLLKSSKLAQLPTISKICTALQIEPAEILKE